MKEKEMLDIKLLYLSLHNLLKKRYGTNIITRKQLYCELGKHFLVPRNLKGVVIKELENMNLLKKEDKGNIKILDCDINLERDANKFLKKIGLLNNDTKDL